MSLKICTVLLWLISAIVIIDVSKSAMVWKRLDNPQAVCNDFSRAGYFMELTGSDKWIIFLEGGGLCHSSNSCNTMFFRSSIREEFAYNYTDAWLKAKNQSRPLKELINIYMTSMETYMIYEVEGRDMLDSNSTLNPIFHEYNRILIPYCSSDLWAGIDYRNFPQIDFNLNNTQEQFLSLVYDPESESLQFTFRGRMIIESVIGELMNMNLSIASDVILAGSSAGGIGAISNAQWIRNTLPRSVNLSAVTDSSWFINYRNVISGRISDGDPTESLLSILAFNPACRDISYSIPCCISVECMLSSSKFFPSQEVPVISIVSLYDVYLIGELISNLPETEANGAENGIEQFSSFFSTIVEYGGVMDNTIMQTLRVSSTASFIITRCFQHVYLSSCSLWDTNGLYQINSIQSVDVTSESFSGTFIHTIRNNFWSSYYFNGVEATSNSCNITTWTCSDLPHAETIQDAICIWTNCRHEIDYLMFRDNCSSVNCNQFCQEKFDISVAFVEYPLWAKVIVAIAVGLITIVSLVSKIVFRIWKSRHIAKSNEFFEANKTSSPKKFPSVNLKDAISVACLDVKYSMTSWSKLSEMFKRRSAPAGDEEEVYSDTESEDGDIVDIHYLKPPKDLQVNVPEQDEVVRDCSCFKKTKKQILKGVTAYFNPGELTAIMGPSGCGKTTLLDLLTGRRDTGTLKGDILINGVPLDSVRDDYVSKTGYVLQLATPYYEQLTVRENLTLAAQMKLSNDMSWRDKFERVEQVMKISGLKGLENRVVGGLSGPGISGGQKKRLVIALQLLTLPTVLFLDEPTSGLDAAAAVELLTHLYSLAATNRTVILTIHQPRFQIFHMFHRLLLLSDGKIAYYGPPHAAYQSFANALFKCCLNDGRIIREVDQNPADVIMDVLAVVWKRKVILEYYESSPKPALVKCAVKKAKRKKAQVQANVNTSISNDETSHYNYKQASWFNRMSVLEARASKMATIGWTIYLPVFFFFYAILLGTVYVQQSTGLLIISGYCVYSVASALFMFPLLHNYYTKALEVYRFEKADGAGRPFDLILQGFTRYVSIGLFPVIGCSCILYLLLVNIKYWSASVFFQLIIVGMALNQTWIALLILVLNAAPNYAIRISPVISSVAGFSSGFFIPREQTPYPYYLLFYINPNYFGFSASANLILSSFNENCSLNVSSLGCFLQSGDYALSAYYFDDVRPYMNIACLMLMTGIFLICAIFANWLRHSFILKKVKFHFNLLINSSKTKQQTLQDTSVKQRWLRAASRVIEKDYDYFETILGGDGNGNNDHTVFIPGQLHKQFAKLVLNIMKQQKDIRGFKDDLRARQQMFNKQVETTQNEVKQQVKKFEDMSPEERKENLREISSKLKDQDTRVANIFSQIMARAGRRVSQNPTEIALRAAHKWLQKVRERKQQQQSALEEEQQSFLTQVTDMSYGELNENDLLSDQHRLELELRQLLITGMTPQFAVTRHDHHISLDVTDSEFLY